MFQSKAGYIDARPPTANSSKTSCNARPDHTFGSFSDLGARVPRSALQLRTDVACRACQVRTVPGADQRARA